MDSFANVLLKKDRCDLTISFEIDIISDALNQIIRESPVGEADEACKQDTTKDELLKTYLALLGTLLKGSCAIF